MVRLGVRLRLTCNFRNSRFNSSMVRLEGSTFLTLINSSKFQFQYGSIGSIPEHKIYIEPYLFQFQYGSIGKILTQPCPDDFISVSIPVWFDWELLVRSVKYFPVLVFQFQYGSIGSQIPTTKNDINLFVSIPVWFDWEDFAKKRDII